MKSVRSVLKYVIAGGSAAAVNLGLLFLLTEYANIYYLYSAVISFTAALFVSFVLQKFWTFGDDRRDIMHWQMAGYLLVALGNVLCNTLLIFLFVEFLHLWYLLAAILAGGMLAVITYFIYRNVIFAESGLHERAAALFEWVARRAPGIAVLCGMLLVLFFATYKLTESPPTWLDEGIITQVAMNIAERGPHAVLKVSPGQFVPAGYVSTSYPVTFPLAASFRLFGPGLLPARAVMALFIIAFVYAAYRLMRRETSRRGAFFSLFLVATFAPLYGNGKNVLGEVPGLFYLIAFLLLVRKIETRESTALDFALAGALLGLAAATKPIFLLVLLPVGIVFALSRRLLPLEKSAAALAGFVLPMLLWFATQFNGETLSRMLAIYANPHNNNIASSVAQNALSFVTAPEPFYALALLAVWLCSIGVRLWRKQPVSRAEYIAVGFAALVYLAYLRGAAYYRYFFLGEVLALLYLPHALATLWRKDIPRYALGILLALLVALQLYQTVFRSWVADYYSSHRSRELSSLAALQPARSVLLYQAPEAAIFLPAGMPYYQYLEITKTIEVGKENLALLSAGAVDVIVIPRDDEPYADLSRYRLADTLDRYDVWYKKGQ